MTSVIRSEDTVRVLGDVALSGEGVSPDRRESVRDAGTVGVWPRAFEGLTA